VKAGAFVGCTGGTCQHRVLLTTWAAPNVDTVPVTPPQPRRAGRAALLSFVAVLVTTAACGSNQPAPISAPDSGPTSPAASSASLEPSPTATAPTTRPASSTSQKTDNVTTIRITVDGDTVTGELNDNPTAQDLAGQLPLSVTLADFNGVEKVGELPRPLTMDGVPAGADPEINDIGYYRPTNGLVFYYGDVGYFNGIVRIGRLSPADMQRIQRQTGSFTIDIEEG
jgi:hypothetical protein